MAREPQMVDGLEEELPGEETQVEDGDEGEGQGALDEDDAEGDERDASEEGEQDDAQGRARPVERQGRRGYGDLRRDAREANERSARLEREVQELRQQTQQHQAQLDPELERQRLELMSPEERTEYRFNKATADNDRKLALVQVQLWDSNDRNAFRDIVASNPTAAKYKDEVEELFQAQLSKGNYSFSRNDVLNFVVGRSVLKRAPAAAQKQRQAGQGRIDRQRTNPANGRSTAPARRSGGQTAEDRLSDVTF